MFLRWSHQLFLPANQRTWLDPKWLRPGCFGNLLSSYCHYNKDQQNCYTWNPFPINNRSWFSFVFHTENLQFWNFILPDSEPHFINLQRVCPGLSILIKEFRKWAAEGQGVWVIIAMITLKEYYSFAGACLFHIVSFIVIQRWLENVSLLLNIE